MSTTKPIQRAVRLALFASTALAAAGTYAADQPISEVIVTGSRIATTGLDSPSPVQVISSEDINNSGVPNLQDLLLKNPVFGSPTISRTNSNFSTASAGAATVDLRNLGIDRTLVLVDGRRFVSGIPGSPAVDFNTIPTGFVERVENLTGGASAVYGSDAVAGVVNLIYKKNFEGIAFDSQYGESEEGDDEQRQFGLTVGTNTSDGRGNVMGYLGYTRQGAVFSRDRPRSAIDQISTGAGVTGDPADIFKITRPFFSSFAESGRFFTSAPGSVTVNDQGQIIPFSTNGTATVPASGFNRNGFRTIAIPTERYLFAGRGNFEFAEKQSVFFEGTYASTQTRSKLEPFPLDSVQIYDGGRVPAEFMVNGMLVANPIIPTGILATTTDRDGDGARDFNFTRRLTEIAARGNKADRDTFRIVGGLQGEFLDNWSYEGFYSYGSTKESQVSSGQVNVQNFRNALEAIADVQDVDGDGNLTEAVCRDATARLQGCVPINLFGRGSITPDQANYVAAPGLLGTFTTQKVAGLNLSGEVFELPAGKIGIAVGAEWREEFSRSEFDALQQRGLNAGNAIPRTEGEFDVIEGYTEVSIPLLADKFLADNLTARGAVRVSDYSTVGNTTSWNAGLEWSPIEQLRFRAIRAQSTRAPNINELFSPPSQNFPQVQDPCDGVTLADTSQQAIDCRTDPGVLANIAANGGVFTLSQADRQGVSGFDLGNPNLNEEEGRSLTLGAVIQPTGIAVLEDFSFTVDYFEIKISDAIIGTPRQFILGQCYGGNRSFCNLVRRRPNDVGPNNAGSLDEIDSPQDNSAGVETEGIDFTVNYNAAVGPGQLVGRLAYTRLLDGFSRPLAGADKDVFEGEVGAAKDRATGTIGYTLGKWSGTWTTTYIGSSDLDDQFLAGFDLPRGSIGIDEVFYSDFQVRWSPGTYEVYLGANNVFNQQPPKLITGLNENVTGTETDSGTYDAIGRRYYGGFRMKF